MICGQQATPLLSRLANGRPAVSEPPAAALRARPRQQANRRPAPPPCCSVLRSNSPAVALQARPRRGPCSRPAPVSRTVVLSAVPCPLPRGGPVAVLQPRSRQRPLCFVHDGGPLCRVPTSFASRPTARRSCSSSAAAALPSHGPIPMASLPAPRSRRANSSALTAAREYIVGPPRRRRPSPRRETRSPAPRALARASVVHPLPSPSREQQQLPPGTTPLLVPDAPRPRPSRPNSMFLLDPLPPDATDTCHATTSMRGQPRHHRCATHGSAARRLPSPG